MRRALTRFPIADRQDREAAKPIGERAVALVFRLPQEFGEFEGNIDGGGQRSGR